MTTELPPLPKPEPIYASGYVHVYTSELMRAYAAEAVRLALDDAAATLAQAVCDDCENGVQWLNIAASEKFSKDYPHLREAINKLASRT